MAENQYMRWYKFHSAIKPHYPFLYKFSEMSIAEQLSNLVWQKAGISQIYIDNIKNCNHFNQFIVNTRFSYT